MLPILHFGENGGRRESGLYHLPPDADNKTIARRNTLTTGKHVLIEKVLELDGRDPGLSPQTEWKTQMSDKEHAPMVTFNRIDKSAHFSFKGRRYELQGKYNSLDDARQVAEKQCRAMGWNG
jgi:hypothetical protein